MSTTSSTRNIVHPRWVWAAVAVSLAGIVVIGLGVMLLSWWVAIVGVVLLVVGVVVGLRSGWMYDVHAGRPAPQEVEAVVEGDVHEGLSPDQDVADPVAERSSADLDRRREVILAQGHMARTPLALMGGWLVLAVAVLLLVAQWTIYPRGSTGQYTGLDSTYIAIVVALVGLRVVTARDEPHRVAAALGVLAGVVLAALAWLVPHESTGVAVFETLCAALLVLGSLACLSVSRR